MKTPRQEELRGERRHRQIEALDAQRRQAEHDADGGREKARGDDPDEDVHAGEIGGELVAGVGADPHEGAGAERQQPGIAGQQVEPDRGQREHQKRDHHRLQQECAAEDRHDHRGDEQDDGDADPILQDREHRHVGGVVGLELSGLAIEHRSKPRHSRTRAQHANPDSRRVSLRLRIVLDSGSGAPRRPGMTDLKHPFHLIKSVR